MVMHIITCLFVTFVEIFWMSEFMRDLFIYLQLYFGIFSYASSSVQFLLKSL